MLPDDVLLEIFDFSADEGQFTKKEIERGSRWFTCAGDGEASFLDHHAA
jgi:hypothetical protein